MLIKWNKYSYRKLIQRIGNDFLKEYLLFILLMVVVALIVTFLKIKFHISNKIWPLFKIEKDYVKVILSLVFTVILSIIASFICEKLYASDFIRRIISGVMAGVAFLLLPHLKLKTDCILIKSIDYSFYLT